MAIGNARLSYCTIPISLAQCTHAPCASRRYVWTHPCHLVFRSRRRRRWRHRNDATITIASPKLIIPSSVNGVILVNKLSQVNTNGVNTHIYNGF